MKIKAYAKINLGLNVKSKKENGYHELEMIMVPISLHDELEIMLSDCDEYECNNGDMLFDEHNTIVKAVNLLRQKYQFKEHFKIILHKYVPIQAGLAGGSADGAAVLKGINQLLHLQLSTQQLMDIGLEIGADVPFCILSKPAVVKGIGEQLVPIQIKPFFDMLIVKPKQGVSTKAAFQQLDLQTCDHPCIDDIEVSLKKNDFQHVISQLQNSLEQSSFLLTPKIKELKQELLAFGFPCALMSGSGSAVFAITQDHEQLQKGYAYFKDKYDFVSIETMNI